MKSSECKSNFCSIIVKQCLIHFFFALALYTQLTDRRISLDERLTLVENAWRNHSKQMLFDWLSGLMINRKK